MKRKITTTLLSCAALAAFTPSLHAATSLLDTTSASLNSSGGIGFGGLAFSTGSQAYSLASFQFAPVNPFGSGDASLTFRLYSADASTHLPTSTSALASETFSNILFDVSATPTQVTFTNNFTLEANSSYVLELSATGFEDNALATTNTFPANVSVGTSGVTYHGYTWNFGSWSEPAAGLAPWVKLTGTAVPEPSAFVMLGLGAIGLVARRRRVG